MLPNIERILDGISAAVRHEDWFGACDGSRHLFLELRSAYRRWPYAVDTGLLDHMDVVLSQAVETMPRNGDDKLRHYFTNVSKRRDALRPILLARRLSEALEAKDFSGITASTAAIAEELPAIFARWPEVLDADHMAEIANLSLRASELVTDHAVRREILRSFARFLPVVVSRRFGTALDDGNPWEIARVSKATREETLTAEAGESPPLDSNAVTRIGELYQRAVSTLTEARIRDDVESDYAAFKSAFAT